MYGLFFLLKHAGTAFHNAAAASETVALPAVTATAQSTPTASTAAS